MSSMLLPRRLDPATPLEAALHAHLSKRVQKSTYRSLTTSSPPSPAAIDFSSNDFLSLSLSPSLHKSFLAELAQPSFLTGTGKAPSLGSRGSRLLDGNTPYADALEEHIARYHGAPAGLIFNSGFDANVGLFACLPQQGDVVLYDELIHASVHDGIRLSRAGRRIPVRHNDIGELRRVLKDLVHEEQGVTEGWKNVFVATEAVYSMDGDACHLSRVADVVEELLPEGNGILVIDEAHATGVIGEGGKGLVCREGLEGRVAVRLHTFGKALGSSGAIVLCSPLVRSYLINYARPLIYTTFLSFPSLAAIRAAYKLLEDGTVAKAQHKLRSLSQHFFFLMERAFSRYPHIISVPPSCPPSPIFALLTNQARSLASWCQDGGFMVRAVVEPTVQKRRVRVCIHAGNTREELEALVKRMSEWVLKIDIDGTLGEAGKQEGNDSSQSKARL